MLVTVEFTGGTPMKHHTLLLLAVATMAGLVAVIAPAPGLADGEPAPAFVTEIPRGYRDWQWISSAHEAGKLNSLGAVLGNDVAIKAYRDGKLPFPDGTIIAALHYHYVPSDENNKVFGQDSIVRSRLPHKHPVHGQGFQEVRRNRRLGIRSLPGRQTRRRGFHEILLPLPREDQSNRPGLYSLRTVTLKAGPRVLSSRRG
jgi:Cytochrome P460